MRGTLTSLNKGSSLNAYTETKADTSMT